MRNYYASLISWSSVVIVCMSLLTKDIHIIFLAVIIAGIMDMFDGKVARRFGDNSKRTQTFGELTDSLCDLFNFGIVPGLVMPYFLLGAEYGVFNCLLSCIFILCGIFRLARFSADKDKPKVDFYVGVPITICGPLLAFTFVITQNIFLTTIGYVLFSYLMVSCMKFKKI